ncbi:sensor histidine kinase [Labedella phragmitis]|uniref:histidine kinase n=1 Tax=Labedella phragmitis TaxID=2498849 RepID=A0A444PUB9_9MICO|nr:histidine kinase [Labedella phragmitis]RWZ51459.1 sensor histidine kinase [Labedella phragmitis]
MTAGEDHEPAVFSVSPRPAVAEWVLWAAIAVAVTSVSIPTHAALYGIPVPLAFLLGALQGGSILLALVRPVAAAAVHVVSIVGIALTTSAADGPWPIPVLGIIALSVVLVVIGIRARWTVAAATWLVAMLLLLLVLAVAVAQGGDTGGGGTMLIVAASVTGFIVIVVSGTMQLVAVRQEVDEVREESELHHAQLLSTQERARIAREMHDVVAHSMSLVHMRATSARYRLPALDDAAAAEFDGIAEEARTALREMRGLLGVLREDGEVLDAPQPGLADIPGLIASTRAAGIEVVDRVEAVQPEPPTATQLALFRVAQEALSNVVRHAPGSAVEVALAVEGPDVVLRVRNGVSTESSGVRADVGGQGIRGMMERMASVGGTLTHGPAGGSGFLVVARAPLDGPPVAEGDA